MHIRQRWIWTLLAGALLAGILLVSALPAIAAEKSIVWDRFDVDIKVNRDGTFDVAEHQAIRFVEGSFTFGYRNIKKDNLGAITDWAMTDASGNTYTQTNGGNEPYTFTVDDQGDQYVIRWYFPSTNQPETYTLSYKVHDGLRYYEGGDQVWWKAIYSDRQFPVLSGRVRVMVPDPAVIQQYAAYIGGEDARGRATAELLDDNRTILFTLGSTLQAGEDFEVRVQFTPGVVAGAAPSWQQQADAAAAQQAADAAYRQQWEPLANVLFGALGLLLFFGGPLLVYLLWYKRGRDKPVARVADYLPEPPDSVRPGLAGTLIDDKADMQDIVATIVDLAHRKAISITEDKQEGMWKMSTDFIYRRERTDVELAPYEKELLSGLFGAKDEVRLSDLKNKFYQNIPDIKKAMYDDLIKLNYYRESPETVRTQYGCAGAFLVALSVVVGVVSLLFVADFAAAALIPPFGLFVTAIALILVANAMPRKTDEGAEIVARLKAFREYLRNIDKYTDVAAQKEIWDRWLPFAIAFGIDKDYIRKFEAVDAPAPGWYIPSPTLYGPYHRRYYGPGGPVVIAGGMPGDMGDLGGGGGSGGDLGGGLSDASRGLGSSLAGMSAGLGSLLSSASSTFASRPSSSGSSGGGWSGGGGFSGGGSFGGGGGGGGGGGFG